MTFAGLCFITNTLQVKRINCLIFDSIKSTWFYKTSDFHNIDTWVIVFLQSLRVIKKYTCCKIIQKELFTHTVRKRDVMLLFGILMSQDDVSAERSVEVSRFIEFS